MSDDYSQGLISAKEYAAYLEKRMTQTADGTPAYLSLYKKARSVQQDTTVGLMQQQVDAGVIEPEEMADYITHNVLSDIDPGSPKYFETANKIQALNEKQVTLEDSRQADAYNYLKQRDPIAAEQMRVEWFTKRVDRFTDPIKKQQAMNDLTLATDSANKNVIQAQIRDLTQSGELGSGDLASLAKTAYQNGLYEMGDSLQVRASKAYEAEQKAAVSQENKNISAAEGALKKYRNEDIALDKSVTSQAEKTLGYLGLEMDDKGNLIIPENIKDGTVLGNLNRKLENLERKYGSYADIPDSETAKQQLESMKNTIMQIQNGNLSSLLDPSGVIPNTLSQNERDLVKSAGLLKGQLTSYKKLGGGEDVISTDRINGNTKIKNMGGQLVETQPIELFDVNGKKLADKNQNIIQYAGKNREFYMDKNRENDLSRVVATKKGANQNDVKAKVEEANKIADAANLASKGGTINTIKAAGEGSFLKGLGSTMLSGLQAMAPFNIAKSAAPKPSDKPATKSSPAAIQKVSAMVSPMLGINPYDKYLNQLKSGKTWGEVANLAKKETNKGWNEIDKGLNKDFWYKEGAYNQYKKTKQEKW
jgi:hypothetical protein